MKKITALLSLLLVLATLFTLLVSCDRSESIVNAYKDAGYDVYTGGVNNSRMDDFDRYLDWSRDDIEDLDDYQFIYCYTEDGKPAALIINYFSKGEMKDHLIEEDDGRVIDDEAYRLAEEAGLLKNNCQLVWAASEDAVDVFKSAE